MRRKRRKHFLSWNSLPGFLLFFFFFSAQTAFSAEKEWTFLVYLNGNNNLDSYGAVNINQMEAVGSTDSINIVVQWASQSAGVARRLYITRDQDRQKISSPVLQELPGLDMGNWRNLADFIRWGMERYPAKRFFVNIWSHGTGWRWPGLEMGQTPAFSPLDISPDDISGSSISTRELGWALGEAARAAGRKIDLYGSDACLMGMLEIASELADSVDTYIGSQATEPGEGWPYEVFLTKWAKQPQLGPKDVAKLLTKSYVDAYAGPPEKAATLSAYDLSRIAPVHLALANLGRELSPLASERSAGFLRALRSSLKFTLPDYIDLGDFLAQVEALGLTPSALSAIAELRLALSDFVISNEATHRYRRATGVSLWIPPNRDLYETFEREYRRLRLHAETGWGDFLRLLWIRPYFLSRFETTFPAESASPVISDSKADK